MLKNQIGASGRLLPYILQYPDDGVPGGGTGNPPATEGSQNVGIDTNTQANQPANVSNQPTSNQPQTVDYAAHQAAIREMNAKQQEVAAWRKAGFNSPEEAAQVLQKYQEYQETWQNPYPAIIDLLKQNPMQAAQLFGQVFNGQQVQSDPYEKYSQYETMPELVKAIQTDMMGQVEKLIDTKVNPVVQPIQQTLQAQKEATIKAQANSQIDSFIQTYPQAGVTQQAVWDLAKSKGIPMTTLESNPSLVDWLMMESIGGRDEFIKRISNQSVQQYQKQVQSNAQSTAQLTPTGGIPVIPGNVPSHDPGKIKSEMHRMFDIMNQKT
jgi:hypothetical protein